MFKQTVNLKEKMEGEEKARRLAMLKKEEPVKRKIVKPEKHAKSEEIDKVFRDEDEPQGNNFKKINQPEIKTSSQKNYLVYFLFLIIIAFGVYFFWNNSKNPTEETVMLEEKWYMVKLQNNETFYGKIKNTAADPIVINSVYYNYDQAKDGEEQAAANQNLRLVKRGKETYGPSGSLEIVRSQVVYMEPLSEDSKVLQAITNYEK